MTSRARSFDRLARVYQALEGIAFGRDLARARVAYLDRLVGCRKILMLGEGDGRALAHLARLAPQAEIHYLDRSAGMTARALRRLAETTPPANVTVRCEDALRAELGHEAFDAVTTFFFLDCFTAAETSALIGRIGGALRPGGLWLFADFTLPERGPARWRARLWLSLLYGFFRVTTDLSARVLPPTETLLRGAGWECEEAQSLQHGLLTTAVWRRAAAPR